ncbi:MAG: hypothetical protein AB7O57_11475 [Hyphomicrobiaceae bacterium]
MKPFTETNASDMRPLTLEECEHVTGGIIIVGGSTALGAMIWRPRLVSPIVSVAGRIGF